jgi:hypothetical protein
MSAVTASAASAAEFFHEAEGTARVIAKNEGVHKFTAGLIGTIECKKATFTGTKFVPSPQKTVTVAPAYSECTFLGVSGVIVKTNGCTYTFNQPTGVGPFTGTASVNCPAGKKIEFEATGCKIEVTGPENIEKAPAENQELSSITFTNLATTPKLVKVAASVSKIKYTASGTCTVLGKKEDGSYSGTALSDAETEAGEIVGGFIK